jgi:hypothetical protein
MNLKLNRLMEGYRDNRPCSMPPPINELIRRVIEEWINGFPRDKIALDLQIGSGTVSNIISEFKKAQLLFCEYK